MHHAQCNVYTRIKCLICRGVPHIALRMALPMALSTTRVPVVRVFWMKTLYTFLVGADVTSCQRCKE